MEAKSVISYCEQPMNSKICLPYKANASCPFQLVLISEALKSPSPELCNMFTAVSHLGIVFHGLTRWAIKKTEVCHIDLDDLDALLFTGSLFTIVSA